MWPRKFIVLENVGNVLAKDMAEVLDYLKQDFLPHNHFRGL
jgi:site-specific DNA-cytosine methylase